jgi:type II secretory ATPase GspE/PulE/Tfp pilus assembly ATPase PilB-like protein
MIQDELDLNRISISRSVLDLIPAALARRSGLIPIARDSGTLWVASRGEPDPTMIVQLEARTGLIVRLRTVRDPESVALALRRYYPETIQTDTQSPLVELERFVSAALQTRSSDIHVDPLEHEYRVRLRIDGLLRDEGRLDRNLAEEMISAIKVQAKLDIAEHRLPQDGQIVLAVAGENLSLRVATVPTVRGEKLTLRLLGNGIIDDGLTTIEGLGMTKKHLVMFQQALANPQGVILLSGPTGSGKTTTLYAAMRRLREDGTRHILSIENPVEVRLDGVNQVEVDPDGERVSFARALRSALRHDPDVMMVGEIRDAESSDIAIKSALTGHLVLSTVHANSAANVTTRLLDMGVSPFLLGSAVLLVVAQRLVRKPCPHCMKREPAKQADLERFGLEPGETPLVPVAVGCTYCANTGYAGRIGLYELIPINKTIRSQLMHGANEQEIAEEAFQKRGLPTLRGDGALKVLNGWTTWNEIDRVTQGEVVG